jgi:hypothetical protein
MRELREGWENFEVEETRLLRRTSPQESVRQWLMLQRTFEVQLQNTSVLFAPERQAALAQLQSRLQYIAEWQAQHGKSA